MEMTTTKVECISCGKRYFVDDEVLPENILQEEAYPY